jgi:hypothetical protein
MMMQSPEVPINVDPETGRWTTDSLPMLYVPLHFFVNNHKAIEKELGVERYSRLLYDAGYQSAWTWCDHESKQHGLAGEDVFEHYLKRLSQRGWGIFDVLHFDLGGAAASVSLKNSAFHQPGSGQGTGDYMFTGWFSGAMDQILHAEGSSVRTKCHQVHWEGQGGADFGLFRVAPRELH